MFMLNLVFFFYIHIIHLEHLLYEFFNYKKIHGGKNMIDYSKNSFYTKTENKTGNISYFIKLNNQQIEVTKDVYTICHNS